VVLGLRLSLHLEHRAIYLHLTELRGLQQRLAVEQTFKSSHHQAHIQNQLVQLLLWLKHGVLVVVAVVGQNIQNQIFQVLEVVVAAELMPIVYLKHPILALL
jgi:hypothetical protein